MYKVVTRIFLLAVVSALAGPSSALSQGVPNPTQQTIATPQGGTPVFRVTVVGRTVPAVNYRPRSGDTKINFEGTALLPKSSGWAQVSGERGYFRVDARFKDLSAAQRFGSEYTTYVLWAITPEGRATNLGELQVHGDEGRLKVTTELQAFAMVVTAEPYFAVTQPSDAVVLENVIRESGYGKTEGRIETVQAKYELLKRGSYLMNQDPGVLKIKPLEPGAPLDLAQARTALELARIAGADRYASDSYRKAAGLLAEAEGALQKKKKGQEVQQPARQAAQTAEDARLIALQRQEEEFEAQQRKAAQQREAEITAQLRAEEEKRKQAELERQRIERERAAADAARVQAEAARAQAEAARAAAEKERLAAERARADLEKARAEAETARAAAVAQAEDARRIAAQRESEAEQARQQLRDQLNSILETRETARGLIVNLSDVLFDVNAATLKPETREKLARVAGILSAHRDLKVEIEGHTDSTGSDDYNQKLSERRADSVRAYLTQQGIGSAITAATGFGETRPVATNDTPAGRQQNRRVELVVSGESIGRTNN